MQQPPGVSGGVTMKFFENERLMLVGASGKTEQLSGLVKIQGARW